MGQSTSEVRARVEHARERLGADVEALAYQANVPKRIRERARARLEHVRARVAGDPRTQAVRSGVAHLRHGERREGVREIAEAAKQPAVVGLLIGAGGVAVSRLTERTSRPDGDAGRKAASGDAGVSGARPGDVIGLMTRPAFVATMHLRQAKKSGRSPGAKQFLGYAAVGVASTALTKWANDRIDRTAPPRSG